MSREAMKLALEALEWFTAAEQGDEPPINKAIIALKQALEQPEPEPVAWAISYDGETPYTLWDGGDCALLDIEVKRHGVKTRKMPLYTFPPKRELEPEPVAVVSGYYGGKCVVLPTDPARIFNSGTAFYIHPPKREWQGLTDEEIMQMLDYGQYGRVPTYARNFVDAIEAKLKEKNT